MGSPVPGLSELPIATSQDPGLQGSIARKWGYQGTREISKACNNVRQWIQSQVRAKPKTIADDPLCALRMVRFKAC